MRIECIALVLCIIFSLISTGRGADYQRRSQNASNSFPDHFKFGISTSAYQIEGAWNVDGKGWSMWDYLVQTQPDTFPEGANGDVAANSYYLYKRDIEMLKELGVDIYRFSISWPRILPYGRANYINQKGIAYYNALIDELLANGITPFVTIYHWDLPQNLSEQGGWLNEDLVELFGDYARIVYRHFGDRVKHWLTINEPYVHCYQGYVAVRHAPRINLPATGYYECSRHLLLAHANAYHIYQNEFKWQGGEVGIVLSMEWGYPSSDSVDDAEAVLDYFAFKLGIFMDPIFTKQGNYPQRLIDRVANRSLSQGFETSRLRPFSPQQIEYIRSTFDFLGLNHYTTDIVYRNASIQGTFEVPSYYDDAAFMTYQDSNWPASESFWLREHAPGFYNILVYIMETYDNPKIYVTENGFSSATGLNDDGRVQYLKNYLNALSQAIKAGVNVHGYSFWSLMDNFEWTRGFTIRFGLYEIDMNDPNRTRTPRKSCLVYKNIINNKFIDWDYDPDPHAEGNYSANLKLSAVVISIMTVFNLIL